MNKRLLMILLVINLMYIEESSSQCMLFPVNLNETIGMSELVVEGDLKYENTFKASNGSIYSVFKLFPTVLYKGTLPDSVIIVSLGGILGNQKTEAFPSDELKSGKGFFFLKKSKILDPKVPESIQYELSTTGQGKLWINESTLVDVFNRYSNYENFVLSVVKISGPCTILIPKDEHRIEGVKRATPVISSISPSSRSAGTDSVITIKGSNFNASRGSGLVGFRNANDGGSSFIQPLSGEYVSWSDTMIVVKVPTSSGTGSVAVINSDPASVVSSSSLSVPYNLINVTYSGTHYGARLQGLNSNASMSFIFNNRFNDSIKAKSDFMTAVQNWRCKTRINYDTFSSVSTKTAPAYDSVNLVLWDFNNSLSTGVLGVAISNFVGCNSGTDWWTMDLDVIFNDIPFTGYQWEYGPGTPNSSSFDFESVALHELGHGHLLGHVIDPAKVMNYSISNGQRKNTISTQDSLGAIQILKRSINSICGKTAMTTLNNSNCLYVALPYILLNIEAVRTDKGNLISWRTNEESLMIRFSVQRLHESGNWLEIGTINAINQQSSINEYRFTDYNSLAVIMGSCYRVVGIDVYGKEMLSPDACIEQNTGTNFFVFQVSQNTFKLIGGLKHLEKSIHVYNGLGQEINFNIEGDLLVLKEAYKGFLMISSLQGNTLKTYRFVSY